MPPGTSTEWRALETAVKAKRTQGKPNATREEKTNLGNQPKPERATTPPETPTKAEGASNATRTTAYGVLVQACWTKHKRQYPDELIHKEIEEFNKQCSVCWYNLSEQEWNKFQGVADRRNAQQTAGQVINAKVDGTGRMTTRNKILLRPVPTRRVARMNKATPMGRPPVGDKSSYLK